MAVKVVLMADVKDVGSEGDIVTVADGYARNFLLPRKLAAPVTQATMKRLDKMRVEREKSRKAKEEKAAQLAEKLSQASCTIAVKVGDADKMFGSVTGADIADALKAQGFDVDKSHVQIENPIRDLGVYEVPVRLSAEVSATVKVWVVEE